MKSFKLMLVFSLLMGGLMLSERTEAFASSLEPSKVEEFFDQQLQQKIHEHHIPNATLSVVADGKVILEKGYGYANLEKQLPVDPKLSSFRIGSASKLFTWTAVMQLVEQGKLNLDEDVNTYLDFEIPAKLLFNSSEAEPAPITLTHLLSHTAGFEDYSESIFRFEAVDVVPLNKYIKEYLPKRAFPAGELIAYSNYGTALAGYIVERVSGLPFAEYVEQHIFAPLGMVGSTFKQPLPAELAPHMTQGYRYVDGEYKEGAFMFMPNAAGGMSSTAADMSQFMLAYLQDGATDKGRILAAETVQQMRNQLYTSHPSLQGMAYGFIEGEFNGRKTLFHSGNTMLFDTGLYLLPEENAGVFISYSGGNYLVHKQIFQAFLDEFYPVSSAESDLLTIVPPEGTKERSSQYIGEYHQNRKSFTTSEKFTSLMMGPIQINWDDEGYLLVNNAGIVHRFVEAERGIYIRIDEESSNDPFSDFNTIVFAEDPLGNTILMADGPLTYSKAKWYGTTSFTFSALVISLLFIIGTLVYNVIISGVRSIRRRKLEQPKLALAAKWTATVYSLLAIGFVIGAVLTGAEDPVYILPKTTFGVVPAWSALLDKLPLCMTLAAFALLVFTVLAWLKKYWGWIGRIHYSLYTGIAVVLTWLFYYWNLL